MREKVDRAIFSAEWKSAFRGAQWQAPKARAVARGEWGGGGAP